MYAKAVRGRETPKQREFSGRIGLKTSETLVNSNLTCGRAETAVL